MGANALLCGLLCLTLPETANQPTLETINGHTLALKAGEEEKEDYNQNVGDEEKAALVHESCHVSSVWIEWFRIAFTVNGKPQTFAVFTEFLDKIEQFCFSIKGQNCLVLFLSTYWRLPFAVCRKRDSAWISLMSMIL